MAIADRLNLALAAAFLAAGIGAFYYLGTQPLYMRVLVLLAAAGAGTGVALLTQPGKQAWSFFKEARLELRKVVWPTRRETTQMTLVVIVVVLVMALFLWVVDWALVKIMQALMG